MLVLSGMSARTRLILFAVAMALLVIIGLALVAVTHPGMVMHFLSDGPDVVNRWH